MGFGEVEDVVVADEALAVVNADQFVVDGVALTKEFVLQGDQVAGHARKDTCWEGPAQATPRGAVWAILNL